MCRARGQFYCFVFKKQTLHCVVHTIAIVFCEIVHFEFVYCRPASAACTSAACECPMCV